LENWKNASNCIDANSEIFVLNKSEKGVHIMTDSNQKALYQKYRIRIKELRTAEFKIHQLNTSFLPQTLREELSELLTNLDNFKSTFLEHENTLKHMNEWEPENMNGFDNYPWEIFKTNYKIIIKIAEIYCLLVSALESLNVFYGKSARSTNHD
jgi:hypothetical protein